MGKYALVVALVVGLSDSALVVPRARCPIRRSREASSDDHRGRHLGLSGPDRLDQYGEIDAVFSKTLRVLGHAERFEPVSNLLHRGH